MKKIFVTISPDGTSIKTNAEGFSGESCQDPIKSLSKKLGSITEQEKKAEFYETENLCEDCHR